uniref:Uncharacterized protein n=1 Tax=Coccidioides posadasii RMSCC 3488 TaxID=454284 RepID=A0A0J6F5V6_COCPO|nr:hypothetical protein CPAG_04636 [Coccidioides posadasii RMSCC 3488]
METKAGLAEAIYLSKYPLPMCSSPPAKARLDPFIRTTFVAQMSNRKSVPYLPSSILQTDLASSGCYPSNHHKGSIQFLIQLLMLVPNPPFITLNSVHCALYRIQESLNEDFEGDLMKN